MGSVAGRKTETALWMLEGAQARGIDVIADVYPYLAGSTGLSSTVFDESGQERMGGICYGDIELTRTGERLTETFASLSGGGKQLRYRSFAYQFSQRSSHSGNLLVRLRTRPSP